MTSKNPQNEAASTWQWIDLPHSSDARGSITFLEHQLPLPFEVRRIYYLLDVPSGATRGHHAHRHQQQIIIPMAGAFTIHIENRFRQTATLRLDKPQRGLCFGPMHWHHLSDFTPGAVCLILSSAGFHDPDYIRDYPTFLSCTSNSAP